MSIDELKKDFNEVEVNTFLKYLESSGWKSKLKESEAINFFKQAKNLGLYIDGESVTLGQRAVAKLDFNYQAYKNLVLQKYPEAIFDIQNVFDGDVVSFMKESGKVLYNHKIGNPFDKDKKIIGCYCIIKIKTGEFIELMSKAEVDKCKSVAKTKTIWDNWESEMFLKTIIKRACKRHFKDIVKDIDDIDNEDYDLTKVNSDVEMITQSQKDEIDKLGIDKIKACLYMKANCLDEMTKEQADKIINLKKVKNDNT